MGDLQLQKETIPSVPSAGYTTDFVDTTDNRRKTLDEFGNLSILQPNDRYNYVVNGGLSIQQRVAVAATAIPSVSTTTRAGQVADRFAVTTGNTTTTLWTQTDARTTTETNLLAPYYGRITQNTNAAKFIFSQFFANFQIAHLRGKKVRVSCKIKQFAGSNANYRLGLLQLNSSGTVDVCPAFISAIGGASVEPTWGTNLVAITPDASPSAENGTISGVAVTIASTANWVRSSAVFSIPATALNLCLVLYRDTIGAASDSVGIAEIQMTLGTEIIDWSPVNQEIELSKCKLFFDKSFPQATVPVQNGGVNGSVCSLIGKAGATALACHIPIRFSEAMWKVPVVTLYSPSSAAAIPFRIDGTTPAVQTAVAQIQLTDNGLVVTATGDAAGAVGDLVGVHYTSEAEFIT